MCETEIKIAYIKKHMYRDRKEITHVKIGEETHTSLYIYIYIYENKVQYVNKWSQDQYTRG